MARDDPGASSFTANVEALLAAGRLDAAEAACASRIASNGPGDPVALGLLGVVRLRQGRFEGAEALLRAACLFNPTLASPQATLATFYLRLGRFAEAVDPLQTCVLLEPRVHHHRLNLVAVYEKRQFAEFSEDARRAMLACLADDELTHSLMVRAWLSLLRLDPAFTDTLQWFASPDYAEFRAGANAARAAALETNALLGAGLVRFLVPDPLVEQGLRFARRWFLDAWNGRLGAEDAGPGPQPPGSPSPGQTATAAGIHLTFLCTLARWCFLGEYVLATSAGEEEALASLREVDPRAPGAAAAVALLACYEPLGPHPEARRFADLSPGPGDPAAEAAFRALVRVQIHEPAKEAKLATGLPTLGGPTEARPEDRVSRAVQAQYEENPYPRWTTIGRAHLTPGAGGAQPGKGKNILVAGCGTGREAIEVAFIFPAARVDALDLSRKSLAYAVRMARDLSARNAFFLQGNLLDAWRLKKSFDLVVCSGVLHHLEDPAAGLRALTDPAVLRAGGVLKLGLYSTRARAEIALAREFAAREGFAPNREGVRTFRAAILARPESDPVRQRLTGWDDFYAVSACRDLVFHVQEHTFTLPEVEALIAGAGLAVFAVAVRNPKHLADYRARFPDDPDAATLGNWDILEREQPSMFAGMYSLWLCRVDERPELDVAWIASTGRM